MVGDDPPTAATDGSAEAREAERLDYTAVD